MMEMDWSRLYFGPLSRDEIQEHVKDVAWQELRLSLLGEQLSVKYAKLASWLTLNSCSRVSQVQVTNYVTALSRGGLIKPEDYLGPAEVLRGL